eukprot:c8327_g1_i1.p1 GENE.c8327_g1_i1~~c8327_g1_i1.p1  ORF type:complete len:396 (+),score=179.66 c8327_g1_i1:41-1228(+)
MRQISFICLGLVVSLFILPCLSKRALVLGGGGARGAFQIGVLEKMCEGSYRNSWEMVIGSSMGAVNAAILAQYDKNEQCEKGVPALKEFWNTIRVQSDVFESHSWISIGECLNPINLPTLGKGWFEKGGMCSPKPAQERLRSSVSQELLRASNMKLYFPSTSFEDTEHPIWLTGDSENVIEHLVGATALPLLFPPVEIDGTYYMDGGCFTNLPISKAIELGAYDILSIPLSPLEGQFAGDILEAEKKERLGPTTLDYIYNVFQLNTFLKSDIRFACQKYKNTKIMAVIPDRVVGTLTEFNKKRISEMIQHGSEQFQSTGFVDLCQASLRSQGSEKDFSFDVDIQAKADESNLGSNVLFGMGIVMIGALAGGFVMFVLFSRKNPTTGNIFVPISGQ